MKLPQVVAATESEAALAEIHEEKSLTPNTVPSPRVRIERTTTFRPRRPTAADHMSRGAAS
jgi:hypothetical protein